MRKRFAKKQIVIMMVSVLVLALIGGYIVVRHKQPQSKIELKGWIDCQPMLSPQQSDVCAEAKRQNYPYIAY